MGVGLISSFYPAHRAVSLATLDTKFFFPEKVAKKSFLFWGKYIIKYSSPVSGFRKFLTLIFCVSFFLKIFIGLPVWPFFYKIRKLWVKDDSKVKILEISALKGG